MSDSLPDDGHEMAEMFELAPVSLRLEDPGSEKLALRCSAIEKVRA